LSYDVRQYVRNFWLLLEVDDSRSPALRRRRLARHGGNYGAAGTDVKGTSREFDLGSMTCLPVHDVHQSEPARRMAQTSWCAPTVAWAWGRVLSRLNGRENDVVTAVH